MPRPTALSETEVTAALETLPGWSLDQGKLYREFRFADFNEAFGFMTRAALLADKLDHHPEWFNVYATVRVHLTTHDAGGITTLDLDLAKAMNDFAA